MVTNSGNSGNGQNNSSANRKSKKEGLKLDEKLYWKLSFHQQKISMCDDKILVRQKEHIIKKCEQKIANLEAFLIEVKIGELKQRKINSKKELEECRAEIGAALNIKDINKYIIKDNLEVIHEDELVKNI